jgi:ammonium transporter, Amt family
MVQKPLWDMGCNQKYGMVCSKHSKEKQHMRYTTKSSMTRLFAASAAIFWFSLGAMAATESAQTQSASLPAIVTAGAGAATVSTEPTDLKVAEDGAILKEMKAQAEQVELSALKKEVREMKAANDVAIEKSNLNMVLLVMVFAGALVFFMQLGFAFLESGMSRTKNTVNVLMKNYSDMLVGGLAFWAIGYGLMFGKNQTGFVGSSFFFPTELSSLEFGVLFFQIMFASAAATIVSGAIAERTRFSAYLIGSVVITAFIYPVVGSWIWGSNHGGTGWLKAIGFIDFAGSTVVHSVGGWCALAALIVVKPRLGRYGEGGVVRTIQGHNLTSTVLGGLVLWVGWFGFNAGSAAALTDSTLQNMGKIALNTHLAGCAAGVAAQLTMFLMRQKVLLSTTINSSIGGLVAVTAGSALMDPQFAIVTGLVAGLLVPLTAPLMDKLKLDDVVGAISVHLVCGVWGTLAVGLFNPATFMSIGALVTQLIGVLAVGGFTFTFAFIGYSLINVTVGMRVPAQAEQRGLDISEHNEVGYPEFQHNNLHAGATPDNKH